MGTKHTRLSKLDIVGIIFGLSFISFIPHFNYLMIGVSALSLILMELSQIKKTIKENGRFVLLLSLVFLCINICVNIKNGGDKSWSLLLFNCIVAIMFAHQCFEKKSLQSIYYFTMICNILVVLSFVDVVYKVFLTNYDPHKTFLLLCGYDNGLGCYLIPIFCINFFLYYIGKTKYFSILIMAISAIQIFAVQSATAIVGISLSVILAILSRNSIYRDIIKPAYLYVASIVIFILIIILRIYDYKVIHWFVEDILHRSMNFTGRTAVWNGSIAFFLDSPIWGHGRNAMYQKTIFFNVTSSHNIYLDVLVQSGIVGLTLLGVILTIISLRGNMNLQPEKWFVKVSFFALIVTLQFESYCGYDGYPLIFFWMMFAHYITQMDYELDIRRLKEKKVIFGRRKNRKKHYSYLVKSLR